MKIILLHLCFFLSMSIGSTQTTKSMYEQVDFETFSTHHTKYGLEAFWKEMYANFRFTTIAQDSMVSGVIEVCIIINEIGTVELYSNNHLGFGINKELETILQKSLLNIKSTIKNMMTIGRFGFCESDALKEPKAFENCHLIFVYANKNKFVRD